MHAAREMETLEAIRIARETRDALETETWAFRARLERQDAARWADDVGTREAERAASRAAETLHAVYESREEDDDAYDETLERETAAWRAHEVAWEKFTEKDEEREDEEESYAETIVSSAPSLFVSNDASGNARLKRHERIRISDVPWPPSVGEAAIKAMARLELSKDASLSPAAARRRAYRKLSLRWHPDKFHARRRGLLSAASEPVAGLEPGETHAEAIARRVRVVAQELNDAWKNQNR
jgi:hypothetical protein